MSDTFVRTLLQAEIMALLHDVGKLHWRFVGEATADEEGLKAKHTKDFWKDADSPFVSLLQWELPENWLPAIEVRKPKYFGSLLASHHGSLFTECFVDASKEYYPELMLLIMYADTADSLFAKGGNTGNTTQKNDIHLAYPQGGKKYPCEKENVDKDADALAHALNVWFGTDAATWDLATLKKKRIELMNILEEYASRHMAETRLPNNDVSLWQHSYSVASIFKALLAQCLYTNTWDKLLSEKKELIHAKQNLSMFAIRFDAEEWMGRSLRSYEVVGRQLALKKMLDGIKKCVEEELALGNEIYRDHTGICFLAPSLPHSLEENSPFTAQLQAIAEHVDGLINSGHIDGDLTWKMQVHATGLRLTSLLDFWQNEDHPSIAYTAQKPKWTEAWEKAKHKQICPRCGVRPVAVSHFRVGSSDDEACDKCKSLAESGYKWLKHEDASEELFGLKDIPFNKDFFGLIEWEQKSVERQHMVWGTRLALVQGVLDMQNVQSGQFCDVLLKNTVKTLKEVQENWKKCCTNSESTRNFFADLFGNPKQFADATDGWCAHVSEGSHPNDFVQAYVDTLIFGGKRQEQGYVVNFEHEAKEIYTWALRQHPAPSRMAQFWNEAHTFMQSPFGLAQQGEPKIPFVPLHCDIESFQMLVPAKEALNFMQNIAASYAKKFAQVRHVLPLHLSASIFYYKAPLYIAMDAAKRFKGIKSSATQLWILQEKIKKGDAYCLQWKDHKQRPVTWSVPADTYRNWFLNEAGEAVYIENMQEEQKYKVLPSSFDFEVLDASTRRYDIFYEGAKGRPHFMMPKEGPRPYPLEVLETWNDYARFFVNKNEGQGQRHTALELFSKLHADWKERRNDPIFTDHAKNILLNTLGKEALILHETVLDGSFFDLCEWHDFINK